MESDSGFSAARTTPPGTVMAGTAAPGHQHGDELIRRARQYEAAVSAAFLSRRRRVFDELVRHAGVRPGDRVLDVGCGTGYFAARAARVAGPTGRVVGIDPSPPVIRYAARHAPPGCTFHVASAQQLPYPDHSFDVVISSVALHHIAGPGRPTALTQMRRVLRPGGRLLIAEFRAPRGAVAGHLTGLLAGPAMQHNPIDEYADLIVQAGFTLTGRGDCRPLLTYLGAGRPAEHPGVG
jgi:ubiquinone/menaquinone biosynthesis C-methylase UbiE